MTCPRCRGRGRTVYPDNLVVNCAGCGGEGTVRTVRNVPPLRVEPIQRKGGVARVLLLDGTAQNGR